MRGSLGRALLPVAIAVWSTLITPAAHAGALKCSSHSIVATDERNAWRVARRAAGTSTLVKASLNVCMNPGSGRAWYDAKPEPQPDGSVLRPHVLCNRGRGAWACELSKPRTAKLGGHEFGLPADLDMEIARRLVARASEVAPGLLNSQECGWTPDSKKPDDGAKKVLGMAEVFEPYRDTYWTQIDTEDDGRVSVNVDGFSISFARGGRGEWEFTCWAQFVVVS